ncbi:MAG: NifU-like protein [Fibrobacteres bacterium]|nr:NifU-like protein [Fibrobacterota bacterium]
MEMGSAAEKPPSGIAPYVPVKPVPTQAPESVTPALGNPDSDSAGNQPSADPGTRKFSKKIETLAANPKHRGAFFTEDASTKDLALATAKYKDVKVYWLVDPQTDLIYDAKFFSYGGPSSVALGEMLCTLAKGMKVESACAITMTQIEKLLRDQADVPSTAAPAEEAFGSLPHLLENVQEVYTSAKALALATITMKASQNGQPRKSSFESLTEADNAWLAKPKEEQLQVIETIMDKDIRPGLNMDGGDLKIKDLEEGQRLMIKWQGACGGCASSTGATLSYIEDSLRRQVFGGMQIIAVEE